MADSRPDLIVAVDFGMTCTGVAYNTPSSGSETIRWIQKWPGRMQANENKVPTVLVYPNHQPQPSSWGYLSESVAEQTADDREFKEWFKTYLDEDTLRERQATAKDPQSIPSSIIEVERLYCDYLRSLYGYIQYKLQIELAAHWDDANIEYIFSVPTTWKPNPTVERFRKVIQKAGFGASPKHTVTIGLTEAEAAACHTAKESPAIFRERDILLVCDVGGGTTDLSALRITGIMDGTLRLEQIDIVLGATLGSTQIDRDFEAKLVQKLESADQQASMGINVEDAAWEMMKSKEYQNAKCDFGSPDDTPSFSVAIPRLNRAYNNNNFGIMDGEMRINTRELQGLFDVQVSRLFELIDQQLKSIQEKTPHEHVSHLVLSGGLGNSAHVQQSLRNRYAPGVSPFPNALNLQVRVAPDPQLVVCKGLVSDRLARLNSGRAILGWRCCRASYGITCKELYNPSNNRHWNLPTEKDPLDNKDYVHVVDWLIKKGEPVSKDYPITRAFSRKMSIAEPYRVFPSKIIASTVEASILPYNVTSACTNLCTVRSDLNAVELAEFKLKNRHLWQFGKKYYQIRYEVKVLLGAADVTFELWFKGQKLSKDNPIKVEWDAAAAPPMYQQNSWMMKSGIAEGVRVLG